MKKQATVLLIVVGVLFISGIAKAETEKSSQNGVEELRGGVSLNDGTRNVEQLARSITNLERKVDRLEDRLERLDDDFKDLKRNLSSRS